MISLALFPCRFTDGARVLGELSAALCLPVYTDEMLLREIAETSGQSVKKLYRKLFGRNHSMNRRKLQKEKSVNMAREVLAELLLSSDEWIYYGLCMSLLGPEMSGVTKVLVVADEECRMLRAKNQEGISGDIARKLITEHDLRANDWTRFLWNRQSYDPAMYDTVITYDCQDLIDVVGYIYMLYEERDLRIRMEETQVAARDMKRAAKVEKILFASGVKAEVKVCEGMVEINAPMLSQDSTRLVVFLTEEVSRMEGVQSVRLRPTSSCQVESGVRLQLFFPGENGASLFDGAWG